MRAFKLIVLLASAMMATFFLYAASRRLIYPYELEWMTGSILDHVERVRTGLPLYLAPTSDWIPFMYPPLYYWVAAQLSRLLPEIIACRAISIVATLAQAAMLWPLMRRAGAGRFWSAVGLGLFFACYSYTAFWYDIERCDPLFMAMIVAATLVLVRWHGMGAALGAGAILGVAFFCKQPAMVFVIGATAALWLRRERRPALALLGIAAVIIAVGTLWQNASTGGWFSYYVWKMPAAHGFDHRTYALFFLEDLPRAGLLLCATVALVATVRRDAPVLPVMLLAGLVAAMTSRLHIGGWPNVLSFWTVFACAAVAVVATRIEQATEIGQWERHVSFALCGLVLVQLGMFAWNPADPVPRPFRTRKAAEMARTLHALDREGEVLLLGTGHVSSRRHLHAAALIDVIRKEGRPPLDLVRALAQRRFAAVVLDGPEELDFRELLEFDCGLAPSYLATYFFSERLDPTVQPPIVGHTARPSWVLRPRHDVLSERSREALERRQRIEMGLAALRMFEPSSIEDLARRIDEGAPWPTAQTQR